MILALGGRMRVREIKWKVAEFFLRNIFKFIHRYLKYPLIEPSDKFFSEIDTVVHVGAHLGEERLSYLRKNLTVFWIEAASTLFQKLRENIANYPKQQAIQAVIHANEGSLVDFYLTSRSASSSMLLPKDTWPTPDLEIVGVEELKTIRLSTLIREGFIKLSRRSMLIIDTQGTELEVLYSASEYLNEFLIIIVEAQNFELYEGQASVEKIEKFLADRNFALEHKEKWATDSTGSKFCYEVVFKNKELS